MKIISTNLQTKNLNQKLLKRQARQILRHEKISSGELSLSFVSDPLIKKLNKQFLSQNRPTDVLAFDLSQTKSPLARKLIFGEIIISTDTAKRNARIFNTSFNYELTLYVVHGILHLLGFDDTSKYKTRLMRQKEIELMEFLNLHK